MNCDADGEGGWLPVASRMVALRSSTGSAQSASTRALQRQSAAWRCRWPAQARRAPKPRRRPRAQALRAGWRAGAGQRRRGQRRRWRAYREQARPCRSSTAGGSLVRERRVWVITRRDRFARSTGKPRCALQKSTLRADFWHGVACTSLRSGTSAGPRCGDRQRVDARRACARWRGAGSLPPRPRCRRGATSRGRRPRHRSAGRGGSGRRR